MVDHGGYDSKGGPRGIQSMSPYRGRHMANCARYPWTLLIDRTIITVA
jgi:hypothetical protein